MKEWSLRLRRFGKKTMTRNQQRKAVDQLVTATGAIPPAVQPTGSRTPNDTTDDNSTESIIDVDAKRTLENVVVDVHVRKDGSDS